MDIIDKIIALMDESGITGATISRDCGLGNAKFYQWKSGRSRPSADSLVKIATYLNTTVEYLTGQTDQKEKPTPVSESEPKSELDIKFEEVTRNLTNEQKMMLIAQIEVLQRNQ